jgi:MHS family proline/betaine transporter-like MFS transporter
MSTLTAVADLPTHDPASQRRATLAGIAGNVMEWYDFAVYGYFARVIGREFFPSNDPHASLLAAFGVFAAGFLMRPLGGLIFGHLGDHIGRKAALTLSVLAMAIPTFLIGLLPSHAQIGVTASVLLVFFRMVQGLSVGGEYTTSVVFLVENAPPGQRGRAGSWSTVGAVAGILLGSAVGALVTTLVPADDLQSWGWRLPFLVGLGVGLTGLYIRKHVPEPLTLPRVERAKQSPLVEAFRKEWRAILRIAGLNILGAVGFYTVFVYLVTWMEKVARVSAAEALDINSLNMLALLIALPIAGGLSDRVGRKPMLLIGAVGMLVLAWPLFWMMDHHEPVLIFLGQLIFTLVFAMYAAVVPVTMVEAFPAHLRCSAVSVGYNLCLGIMGGTAPLVAAWLIDETRDVLSPAFYVMATAVVTLAVILRLPGEARRETAEIGRIEAGVSA